MSNMTERAMTVAREKVEVAKANASYATALFLKDDRGDTNFVSILVLLGIALGLAAVFMTFRDQIVTWMNTQMNTFSNSQANASTNAKITVSGSKS